MSLSDCIKCWDTPCTCGWNYRNCSIEYLEERKRLFDKIIEFRKKNPDAKLSVDFDYSSKETEDDKAYRKFINESKERKSIMKWDNEKRNGKVISATVRIDSFRLSVHHYMGYGDTWFMSCYGICDRIELGEMSLNGAKVMAAARLQLKLEKAIEIITNVS